MSEEYGNIDDYKKTTQGISLAKLGEEPFVIVKVQRSDYDKTPGVGLTTEKTYTFDGVDVNFFYTTREVIVGRFFEENQDTKVLEQTELYNKINNGLKFKVCCKMLKPKNSSGNSYYDLVKATEEQKQGKL